MTTLEDYLTDLAKEVVKVVTDDLSFEDLTQEDQETIRGLIADSLIDIKNRLIGGPERKLVN